MCDKSLDLSGEGAASFKSDGDARAWNRRLGLGEEQTRRVRQSNNPGVGQFKAAHFIGGSITILDSSEQAKSRVPIAFELADDIHQMLK